MTDLHDAVPPHEPAEDALAFAGKVALGAIPVVGAVAAETLAYALQARQAARQHEFNVLIAHSLSDALERLDHALPVEEVVDSDEFLAAVTRAQRVAAETASDAKRRRLAAAVVNSGSWAPFAVGERQQFARLADTLDELQVWLLHYLENPLAWLEAHSYGDPHGATRSATDDNPLSAVFGMPFWQFSDRLAIAVDALERESLVSFEERVFGSAAAPLYARTNETGRRFLRFLNEPTSLDADAPPAL